MHIHRRAVRPSTLATILLLGGALCLGLPAAAQEGEVMTGGDSPYLETLRADWESVSGKLVALVEEIPEEKYGWSPADGVRSVSGVITHVMGPNYALTRSLPGGAEGSMPELGDSPSKEELVAALKESMEHVSSVFGQLDEADLEKSHQAFGREMTGYRMVDILGSHAHEHLGQLIAYARMNGVTPPWSR